MAEDTDFHGSNALILSFSPPAQTPLFLFGETASPNIKHLEPLGLRVVFVIITRGKTWVEHI